MFQDPERLNRTLPATLLMLLLVAAGASADDVASVDLRLTLTDGSVQVIGLWSAPAPPSPPPVTGGMLPVLYGKAAWKSPGGEILTDLDEIVPLPADVGYLVLEYQLLPELFPALPASTLTLQGTPPADDSLLGELVYEGDLLYTGSAWWGDGPPGRGCGPTSTELSAPEWSAGGWIHVRRLVDFEYGCGGWWLEPTADGVSVAQRERWSRDLIGSRPAPGAVRLVLGAGHYADVTLKTAPRGLSRYLTSESGWTLDLCGTTP